MEWVGRVRGCLALLDETRHSLEGVSLDVLTTSDNSGGTALANLLPVEGGDGPPAHDAVDNAEDPQDDGSEETKEVAETHHWEAPGDVDQTLDEAVVEEGELGHNQGDVQLTENHDDTESNADTREDEDGEAVVLVAEITVGAEKAAGVHVDPALIRGAAHAVDAIIVVDTEVVNINGEVLHGHELRASGSLLGPETSLEGLVLGIALHHKLGLLGGPLEADAVEGTSPDIVRAETLSIREGNSVSIPNEPPYHGAREKAISITRNADDAKNSEKGAGKNASDHNNLPQDEFASALLSLHRLHFN